jgi:hypothetical protein
MKEVFMKLKAIYDQEYKAFAKDKAEQVSM